MRLATLVDMANAEEEAGAQQAYLFECDDNTLHAVSLDPTGRNIPRNFCLGGWHLKAEFALGVQDLVPAATSPEPVIRGVNEAGYFIWRDGQMHGTTQ